MADSAGVSSTTDQGVPGSSAIEIPARSKVDHVASVQAGATAFSNIAQFVAMVDPTGITSTVSAVAQTVQTVAAAVPNNTERA